MNITEKIFEIRSYTEIFGKRYQNLQFNSICSTVNKELQCIQYILAVQGIFM